MSRTAVALLGAGAWGLNHVRCLSSEPRCRLVAVIDPDHRACARATDLAPDLRTGSTFADMLADSRIDAIVIATPAPTHTALALAVLEAGKHVLVEKPVALSRFDALRLEAGARASGRVAMAGHLMVFHPAVVRLRELLRSGELGTLHYMHSIRANLGRIRRDESALWSFGPHELSMLDYLLERSPASVTARGSCVLQPGIEDVVFLTLRYADGSMAHVHVSWLHPRKERRFTLVCSQKMVEFDDVATEKLRIYDKGFDRAREFTQFAEYLTMRDGDVLIPTLSMVEPLRLQLAHFLDCIAGTASVRTSMASAVRITATLEAAQRSLALDGQPVDLEPSTA